MSLEKKLLTLFVYIALLSFAVFLINFENNTAPYPFTFFPNIDKNYQQSFNINSLYKPLFILFIWCLHHSLFIREPIRKIIKNNLNLNDKSQLIIYRIIAGILLLLSLFTYNSSNNPIGGGIIWDIQQLSSSNNIHKIQS